MSHPLVAAAAAKSTPFIDWASLGKVAGVSFVFGVAIVVLFSVGLVGVSWMSPTTAVADGDGPWQAGGQVGPGGTATAVSIGSRALGAALAGVSFLICASAVIFGLWLIIPQFHR